MFHVLTYKNRIFFANIMIIMPDGVNAENNFDA